MRLSEFGDAGVLIVDDEKETLRSFSLLLKTAGLKNIITLEDPREALPVIRKNMIATVILDLRMPYLPGAELLRMIKGEAPQIPLIIVTASSELETAVECMKEGAFDYIVKPVEKERLLTSVKKALELSSLRDEISS
ncbi:MAG: response regulator, partial [Nitrospirae bacterium]